MGLAIDTVLGAGVAGSTFGAVTVAQGDSLTVRQFPAGASATLDFIGTQGTAATPVRITSPMLHDQVRGITFTPNGNPAGYVLPRDTGQPPVAGDTLAVGATVPASDTAAVALGIYYSNLPGANARLHSWGDISGIIRNIKPLEVDVPAAAAAGSWQQVGITTTENLLKAGTDYAVLGYVLSANATVVGVVGSDTSNLKVCGPGQASSIDLSAYFVEISERMGTPHIPVINADNANNTSVVIAQGVVGVANTVQLVLAELSQTVTP